MALPAPRTLLRLAVLDFDDTLLPSTALAAAGIDAMCHTLADVPQALRRRLAQVDAAACRLLLEVAAWNRPAGDSGGEEGAVLAQAVVVTNANGGWVEAATAALLPRTAAALTALRVPILSARDRFAPALGPAPALWKALAVREAAWTLAAIVTGAGCRRIALHVLGVGDLPHDRVAVRRLREQLLLHRCMGVVPTARARLLRWATAASTPARRLRVPAMQLSPPTLAALQGACVVRALQPAAAAAAAVWRYRGRCLAAEDRLPELRAPASLRHIFELRYGLSCTVATAKMPSASSPEVLAAALRAVTRRLAELLVDGVDVAVA